jgi:membrane-associated protease RseP (regulator of RpoE activity)
MYRKLSPAMWLLALGWCMVSPIRAGEDESPTGVLYSSDEFPKIWIGVRLSEVPEALAAHLQRGKFMLYNIAEGSPADKAGLERYDVVLSFNGRPIEGLTDLLDAIQKNGADKPAKMVVIHQGQEKTVTVTPLTRNPDDKTAFKYEEGELFQADPQEKYFGHRLKVGPDGKFIFEPQGRLDMMPDDVKALLERLQQFNRNDPDAIDLGASDDALRFSFGGESGKNAAVTLRVDENGKSLSIRRDPNGTVTVERKETNGDSKTVEYENEEQFQKEDPEAYRMYERSFKQHGFSALIQPPDLGNLGPRQDAFQKDLQAEIERAQKQVQQALEEARRAQREAEEQKAEKKKD